MPKRRRGCPRGRPAPEPLAESVRDTVSESASDAARQSSPPIRPSAPAEDPAWRPRVALRCINDPHVGAEARTGKTSNADGHSPDQPEVARPRAVTRSGRISRPPLWYGLGGMKQIDLLHEVRTRYLSFERRATSILRHHPSARFCALLFLVTVSLSLSSHSLGEATCIFLIGRRDARHLTLACSPALFSLA